MWLSNCYGWFISRSSFPISDPANFCFSSALSNAWDVIGLLYVWEVNEWKMKIMLPFPLKTFLFSLTKMMCFYTKQYYPWANVFKLFLWCFFVVFVFWVIFLTGSVAPATFPCSYWTSKRGSCFIKGMRLYLWVHCIFVFVTDIISYKNGHLFWITFFVKQLHIDFFHSSYIKLARAL